MTNHHAIEEVPEPCEYLLLAGNRVTQSIKVVADIRRRHFTKLSAVVICPFQERQHGTPVSSSSVRVANFCMKEFLKRKTSIVTSAFNDGRQVAAGVLFNGWQQTFRRGRFRRIPWRIIHEIDQATPVSCVAHSRNARRCVRSHF